MSYNPTHDFDYILAERNKLQSENALLKALLDKPCRQCESLREQIKTIEVEAIMKYHKEQIDNMHMGPRVSLLNQSAELETENSALRKERDSLRALAGKMAEALVRMGATWHNEFCNGEGEHESECIASDEALATYSKAVGEGEES